MTNLSSGRRGGTKEECRTLASALVRDFERIHQRIGRILLSVGFSADVSEATTARNNDGIERKASSSPVLEKAEALIEESSRDIFTYRKASLAVLWILLWYHPNVAVCSILLFISYALAKSYAISVIRSSVNEMEEAAESSSSPRSNRRRRRPNSQNEGRTKEDDDASNRVKAVEAVCVWLHESRSEIRVGASFAAPFIRIVAQTTGWFDSVISSRDSRKLHQALFVLSGLVASLVIFQFAVPAASAAWNAAAYAARWLVAGGGSS